MASPSSAERVQEVVRSATEIPAAAGTPLTPDQVNRLNELKEKRKKDPLEMLKAAEKKPLLNKTEVDNLVDQKIKDPARNTEVKNGAQLARELTEKKFDNIPALDQPNYINKIADVLKSRPEIKAELDALGVGTPAYNTALKEAAKRILRNPQYEEVVKALLEGTLKDPNAIPALDLADLDIKTTEAKAKRDAKEKEYESLKKEKEKAEEELDKFEGVHAGDPSSYFSQLKEATDNYATNQSELKNREERIKIHDSRLQAIQRKLNALSMSIGVDPAEILRAESDIETVARDKTTLESEAQEYKVKINKKTELEQKRRDLEKQKTELSIKEITTKGEFDVEDKRFQQTDNAKKDAEIKITVAEENYKKRVDELLGNATNEFLEAEFTDIMKKQDEIANKEYSTSKDDVEKKFYAQYRDRWQKIEKQAMLPGGIWKRDHLVTNGAKIDKDYEDLMTSLDPNALLKNILTDGSVAPDVVEKWMKDPANAEKMQGLQTKALERLMQHRIKRGKLTQRDAQVIVDQPWGNKLIDNALTNKEAAKQKIEELMGKGAVQGDLKEWIKGRDRFTLWSIMVILLGAGMSAVGALSYTSPLAASTGSAALATP